MSILRLAHRWAGGLIGLFLAILGLSGAMLVHKDDWLRATMPHAADQQVQDTAAVAAAVTKIFADPDRPRSIVLASERLGLHRLSYTDKERGAYADQTGEIVARWASKWERPEVWLFDLHHYLLIGDTGKFVAGTLGLFGLAFVITGVILWWPTRRLFTFSLWPAKMSRTAVVRQHRDLGMLVSPLLFVSLLTGVAMTLPKVEEVLLSVFSKPAEMDAAQAPPKVKGRALAPATDWRALLDEARAKYPDAEIRSLGLPAKPGALISVRLRQQAEWLPNGRTMFWFDPATGRQVANRDAQTLPMGVRVANLEYPVHAAKVGGLPYRLVMTLSGLTLAMLGTLAVYTFWANPKFQKRKRRAREPQTA
ncbi:MAG: PepSY-associated TM helix domain-containing protein [Pseudomonadota bacterium]|uniref:PepSY-associated TM helix domain-containing protein n=1 Tax=unclassified Phenylobacterium TaxID=2640670 RepID=UPI0009EAA3BD|nr:MULTISPECIES: PepSY-associated TM helix domain-containing protein [unclassified Phenylobacterium]MBT9473489.1 PepSY domain-containing protein [Phenylobacterium sp.]